MIRIDFLYLFLTHFIIPIKEEWAAYCETFDEYQENMIPSHEKTVIACWTLQLTKKNELLIKIHFPRMLLLKLYFVFCITTSPVLF